MQRMRHKLHKLLLKLTAFVEGSHKDLERLETAHPGSDSISSIPDSIHLAKFGQSAARIPGMISAMESHLLLYVSMFGEAEGDIVEIGSWLGRSTVFLAKGCQIAHPNSVVHAIDTFEGTPGKETLYHDSLAENETIFERFKANLIAVGLQDYVVSHRMQSKEARPLFNTAQVRLLFVDGCHKYEAVMQDINLWQPLLSPGGHLLLHDYARSSEAGVIEAAQDTIIRSGHYHRFLLVDRLLVAQRMMD